MTAILFSPHNDDETLFAFYQCVRYKPLVVICLRSYRQAIEQGGPDYTVREAETVCAMEHAGVPALIQWDIPDTDPSPTELAIRMVELVQEHKPKIIIAPAFEPGGHEDHNMIAASAHGLCEPFPTGITLKRYLTYQRGKDRSRDGVQVVGDMLEEEAKLKALLCYDSQIRHPQTSAWFPGGAYHDMREWVA